MGDNLEGNREVLGVSVSLGEHEVHWRTLLQSLVSRGLAGVQLVISDDHRGLQKARMVVFGGVPWQRCQCHLQRNVQAYVPRRTVMREVATDIRAIFNAATRHDAETLLSQTVGKYLPKASALADRMEKSIPEGLTIFAFSSEHHRRIRTTNSLERAEPRVTAACLFCPHHVD